ncbi:hypothetical protein [Pyrobaculum aerophilum]|uniref:Uncharacterized protein n=1 Tax=Pyrobaculum aerophilum TaxID=13773 RepID=A0A371R4D0_9CREN|nr:hypothetical protein [Pyrobaculum aerophilum]RFA94537.1 hypothetical protein CGL51_09835 [Pyrobaculum aerophilum]RFA98652.1 hypothetical protein CGL52_06425 [Pyrobaculum aerophilum]
MKATYILVVIIVVLLIALVAVYTQYASQMAQLSQELSKARAEADTLKSELSQLQTKITELNKTLAQREEQIKALQQQVKPRGLVYAAIREGDVLYAYVIDPSTNDVVAKIDLKYTLSSPVYEALYATLKGLAKPSTLETWTPRYYLGNLPYFILLFENPNGSYVAFIDRVTFRDIKLMKTYDKFTRQYGGVTPDGRYLIISQRQAQRVVFIDLQKMEIVNVVNLDANPCDVAPSPDGKYVFIPVRADQDPNKPEYALILEVPSGREVARYYFKKPGEQTYTEPSMTYWSYYKPQYGILQGEAKPYEAVLEKDVNRGTARLIKEVSYPSIAYMAVENPARDEVVIVVSGVGVYVRSLPPSYQVIKEVKVVPDYLKSAVQGVFSQDGKYYYLAGAGGLVVLDTSTWSVVKYFKADAAVWVVAIPSGEWLKIWGR